MQESLFLVTLVGFTQGFPLVFLDLSSELTTGIQSVSTWTHVHILQQQLELSLFQQESKFSAEELQDEEVREI